MCLYEPFYFGGTAHFVEFVSVLLEYLQKKLVLQNDTVRETILRFDVSLEDHKDLSNLFSLNSFRFRSMRNQVGVFVSSLLLLAAAYYMNTLRYSISILLFISMAMIASVSFAL